MPAQMRNATMGSWTNSPTTPGTRKPPRFPVALIRTLTDTADLRAAGVKPASRQTAIMLLGDLNELVSVTLEDGGDIREITETAIDCTLAILSPRN